MSPLQKPEGIVFGEDQNLPDATALEGFDFCGNLISVDLEHLKRPPDIANLLGYPDYVVRLQPIYNLTSPLEVYEERVTQGIRHFTLLEEAGVQLPSQRFVVSNQVENMPGWGKEGSSFLFSIVERLEGRMLTTERSDSQRNYDTINSIAQYVLSAWYTPQTAEALTDIMKPRQFTVTDSQPSALPTLHDVELLFNSFSSSTTRDASLMADELTLWAQEAGIDAPQQLRKLQQLIDRPIFHRFKRFVKICT